MKKIVEKLRYMEQYMFDYCIHIVSVILGITLVLVSPNAYIALALISFLLHTIKVIKIRIDNKKG